MMAKVAGLMFSLQGRQLRVSDLIAASRSNANQFG